MSGAIPTKEIITSSPQGNSTKDDVKFLSPMEECIEYYATFPFRQDNEGDSAVQYTLEDQFCSFAKFTINGVVENDSNGLRITLYQSDYWMRQAKVLDDRRLTMTDTGTAFYKFGKSELTYDKWLQYLSDLCQLKNLNEKQVTEELTNSGLPGTVPVVIPKYREFFDTYKPKNALIRVTYCNAIYDSFLCWPPTEAETTAFQNCPVARLSDTSQLAYRRCGLNGLWLGRRKNETTAIGWTNYTPCFPAEVQNLLENLYDEEAEPQKKLEIAQNTRYLEIIGFSLSLIALLISLFVFYYFRSLRNARTKIHRNLFLAMILQLIVRLVLYLDQAFLRETYDRNTKTVKGLDSLPYVCEACYISLEYGISAMFCWMFIEGLYLHSIVTANALKECITFRQYLIMGWGAPVVITFIWTVVTSTHYMNSTLQQCWYGYNFLHHYWLCQGPRLAIILINLVFLLNILRVLIGKLNRSEDSEIEKTRKAARAALVLLPLLGITNVLNMVEAPLDGSVWRFALWSYTTHFLRSFQGLFIALIYCFMNGEVRQLVVKMYSDWKTIKNDERRMRNALGRRKRQSFRPWGCFEFAFRKSTEENIRLDEKATLHKYNDPNVLDQLQTIRCDEETNVTDGV